MTTRSSVFAAAFSALALYGQNSSRPEFEVASIRVSGDQLPETGAAGVRIDGSQVRWAFFSLRDYIGAAYRVKSYQISGPEWLETARFDVAATLPPGAQLSQIPEMLQQLLEERFQVKMRSAKRDFAVYVLEVGKGGVKMRAPINIA